MSNLGASGRDPRIYGTVTSLADLQDSIVAMAEGLGATMASYHSSHEGDVVAYLYDTAQDRDAYLINPAALTRFSVPCRIALLETRKPYVELHFANVAAIGWSRGGAQTPFSPSVVMGMRHHSYFAALFGLVCALDGNVWAPAFQV